MKALISILFIFVSQELISQSSLETGCYRFDNIRQRSWFILNLKENKQFEFIIDSDDCTSAYGQYGKGFYSFEKDSIILTFDSIPHLNSSYMMDTITNNDDFIDVEIEVENQKDVYVSYEVLLPKAPKKKVKYSKYEIRTNYFEKKINLRFPKHEVSQFMHIEKKGFYSNSLAFSQKENFDYKIKSILREKSDINSAQFISNITMKLGLKSKTEIYFFDYCVLKKIICR